ncbi:TPA: hypothetical protein N5N87_003436 [Enterobacter hormaechei subsp. steigerwaltii]|nr:hypothetical protein [Enterobacter hormaechei subsp. steigerwaltii]
MAWLLSGGGAKNHVSFDSGNAYADPLREVTPLYTAPPAPVSVPAAMEMDDDFDSAFEHGKAVGWNAYRDAMLKHSEPFIVTSDHRMMEMPQVEAINAVTAMLQGVEPVTTAYKLPFEQWLSQQTGTIDVECGCVMTEVFFHWLRVAYEAGNSPVIPDGWVMVPIEPTEHMIVNGFESEPDESFSDEKEWEAYEAMSGCQQAAHRAKLCWAAMIVAAQKLRKQ